MLKWQLLTGHHSMRTFKILCGLLFLTSALHCNQTAIPKEISEGQVVVNNRILAKVLGKTISVVDVMKKMDVFIDRYYPQYSHATAAKYQFYITNWRDILMQIVDTELMLADAQEREVTATDGEVREELQQRFGPHVMVSLNKLGLTYEEARKMIHSELIVQKMNWLRVHSKALQKVNSQDVKLAYEEFCKQNPPTEEWKYQVLSIRAQEEPQAQELAHFAYNTLTTAKKGLSCVAEEIKQKNEASSEVTVSLSEEYHVKNSEISESHKAVLVSLQQGDYSKPLSQVSRFDNSSVTRIFYLKDHTTTNPPLLQKVAAQLKDELIQQAVNKETESYLKRLRKRYGYDQQYWQDLLPANFQPFFLQ